MGRMDPASLRTDLRDALRATSPGQVAGPVKVSTGYAILKAEVESTTTEKPANADAGSGPATATPTGSGQGMTPTGILAVAGRGKIAYPPDVSGAVEVELAFRKIPKPEGWDRDLRSICETRKRSLEIAVNHLQELLDPNDPESFASTKPEMLGEVYFSLAQLLAYQGKMDPAIEEWIKAYGFAKKNNPKMIPELEEVLGTAYLHKSEMENDIYRAPGDRCLFPPRHPIVYSKKQDSETAIQYLTRFVQKSPDSLEGKWLLNLAYMTLGKYPAGVPAQYLIPPSAFKSDENVVHLTDVAPAVGLDSFSLAGGVIADDFDNDGLLDVVKSSYDMCAPLHFFHNNGDGTFTDRAAQAGLEGQLGGLNIIQADYNNDGCVDIFVLRGGWQFAVRPSLLRNNCDGTFTDVTQQAGLATVMASQTAVWTDIDNDGFLDLFVGNEQGPTRLFRNKGDGTFEDIAHAAGRRSCGVYERRGSRGLRQ